MTPGELVSSKYRLRARLGEGGMAEVWSATNVLTQRDFAIKFVLPTLAKHGEAVQRFFQEAQTTARLRHPSIVDVFDVGLTRQGRPYLVMELLAGESLEARLARERTLGPLQTTVWLSQVARGLHLAHRAGIVHRDLSSANVFLALPVDGDEPVPKILDFGVSKIVSPGQDSHVRTGNGAVLGSPAYMSPEQACGAETVDARSDVWSLGVLAYECLSGRTPFRAKNYNALMLAIVTVPHRPIGTLVAGLDAELGALIESCLVKDRDARTQTALELAEGFEALARRFARSRACSVPGPQRRATDRLPQRAPRGQPVRVPPAARLPARAFPVGIRCWQFLSRATPPGGLVTRGAVGGTVLGMALGVALVSSGWGREVSTLRAASAAVLSRHVRPTDGPPRARLASVAADAERKPSGAPAADATTSRPPEDLVAATARGLGVVKRTVPAAQRGPAAPLPRGGGADLALALVPMRPNPY